MMYAQDYDGRFSSVAPNPPLNAGSTVRPWGWADALQSYINNLQIYQCPSQTDKKFSASPVTAGYTDYWFNSALGMAGGTSGILEAQVTYPANTVMFGDGAAGWARSNTSGNANSYYPNGYRLDAQWNNGIASNPAGAGIGSFNSGAAQRHLDGANYAFTDGHVKWIPGETPNRCMTILTTSAAGAIGSNVYSYRAY